ncbi:MAG: beta-propeller fold lactonase family protein [Bacteroidia bacterium]
MKIFFKARYHLLASKNFTVTIKNKKKMKKRNQFAAVIAAALIVTFSACKKNDNTLSPVASTSTNDMISEKGANPDEEIFNDSQALERKGHSGYVYTESNESAQNEIYIYKQNSNGTLTLQGTTSSGGTGTGGGLGSQGAIVLDKNHEWLFAVNAGSNSVSSFRVHGNGNLTLAYTAGTSGMMPISITVHHNLLYVVNAGSDNIAGLTIGAGGSLTPIGGSVQSLSTAASGPAQIAFSPNGNYLMVTEKNNNAISTFHVNGSGVAGVGTSAASVGQTPFGFEFARGFAVVSNAAGGVAGAGSATSYSGINSGSPNAVNGAVANNQAAPCWVTTTKYQRFAFTANTGSDNISSYYVSPWGALYLINAAIPSGDAPADMAVADNNYNLYARCGGDHTIQQYNRTLLGGLNHIGSIAIPDHAAGLAAF